MSRYAQSLAGARIQALQVALQDATTPDEIRRCAVAILNAPDPCEIDDALEPPNPTCPNDAHDIQRAPSIRAPNNSLAPAPTAAPTSQLPCPPTSHVPPASTEDLAQLRFLITIDEATLKRTLRAQPQLLSLITPANTAAIRNLDLAPT